MKRLYTILFFTDIFMLIIISYLFLKEIDNHKGVWILLLTGLGILFCIILLLRLLQRYTKLPQAHHQE